MSVANSIAKRMAMKEGFRFSLQEAEIFDLWQDLLLVAIRISSRFDPDKAAPEAFLSRVLKLSLKNRRRFRSTQRKHRPRPLNATDEKLLDGNGLPLPIIDPADPTIDPELIDGMIDLPRYLRPLTDDELLTLRAGTEMPMNLAARRRGMAESTFRDQFNRLAARLRAFANR